LYIFSFVKKNLGSPIKRHGMKQMKDLEISEKVPEAPERRASKVLECNPPLCFLPHE
jgi:hypothetical protein